MPSVYIDGVEFKYEGNPMLLQFALDHEVDIPYFCYHPAMSAPTNCRMCLVEVGTPVIDRETKQPVLEQDGSVKIMWGRKPATACNTPITPGMVVKTHKTSTIIKKAQEGVLEFMLINHPLDCPICDQAGECPLQINTYKYGPEGSRFELQKVHKPKRIQLGPRVILDAERCINCTRCVRFSEEITKTNQLSIVARGDKNFPATAPGLTFDDPYSMNVIDLCPVGALTSDAFRFAARVWEMNYTPSVCTSCSNGCNVDVWIRDNQVMRLTPRENAEVNKYWMCDEGRLNIAHYNENRVSGLKLKSDVPTEFSNGLAGIADLLSKHKGRILFVGSANMSVENMYAFKALAKGLGENTVYYVPEIQSGWGDHFLKKDDKKANTAGAKLVGLKEIALEDLQDKASKAELVYVAEDDAVLAKLAKHFSHRIFIAHAHQYVKGHEEITVLIPAANHLEQMGVFVNYKNIAQVAFMTKQIKQMTPEMWMALPKSRLDAGGVSVDNWRHPEHIIDCLPTWQIVDKLAEILKIDARFSSHADIFAKIKQAFEPLKSLKISKKQRKESFKISQLDHAVR